jgi:hypothetical protein
MLNSLLHGQVKRKRVLEREEHLHVDPGKRLDFL